MIALKKIYRRSVGTFIVPTLCVVCGKVLCDGEDVACMPCLAKQQPCMRRGAGLLEIDEGVVNAVAPVGMVEVWVNYDPSDKSSELIRSVKYRDTPRNGYVLGSLFARDLLCRRFADGALRPADIDVLLPMPMHVLKRFRRGYNQSEEIARGMAAALGCAVGDNLVAERTHSTQTRLGRRRRADNVSGSISVRYAEELEGLNVAIVDDIITTGASMSEAAYALSRAGARPSTISLFALGATVGKG